jgi:hypothetical protein
MSELFNKKEYLKNLIKRMNNEKNNESLRKDLKNAISELSAEDIARVEQELIENGDMTIEDIQPLCNVHLDMFKDYINKEKIEVEEDHPIAILMKEHEKMLKNAEKIKDVVTEIRDLKEMKDKFPKLIEFASLVEEFMNTEIYFQKEENVLFPYVEKYGIEKPPAVMWKEHDSIREIRKEIKNIVEKRDIEKINRDLYVLTLNLNEIIANHIFKEHSVLFPTALKLLSEKDWEEVKAEFDDVGYGYYKPEFIHKKEAEEVSMKNNEIKFPTGNLSIEEITKIFNNIPVDITFVDKNDEVKYFSENSERVFVRSKAIIGRNVENCHPQKSVEIVKKILDDFKSGKRDHADFWLEIGDKFVYIKYIAVRNNDGEYMGVLETMQNISPYRKLEGEKRIYDEK